MNIIKTACIAAGMFIVANAATIRAAEPVVEINYIPPIGQGGIAEGRIVWDKLAPANAGQYAVIAILRAKWQGGGDDYVKPSYVNYLNAIDASGNFFIHITGNPDDYSQPDFNFYFVERSAFAGVAGETIKSSNMAGRYLGEPAIINRASFWSTKLQQPVPNIRPGFVPAGTQINIQTPVEPNMSIGYTIRYTLDGSNPATSPTAQTYNNNTFVVPANGSLIIKAVAEKGGKYSYQSNMTWIPYETSNCLFGLNVSLALNGEPFGYRLSEETTQARMEPIGTLAKWIRTFGTINNGHEYVNAIAKKMNLRTLIGLHINNNVSDNNAQLQGLRNILQNGPAPDMIGVGNETSINNVSPSMLGTYLDSVRNIVAEKGMTIPIGSIDIGGAVWTQHVLQKLDFRGVNLYPGTWDSTLTSNMFDKLKEMWRNELTNNPTLALLLTETGTPYAGGAYNALGTTQVASIEKAKTYLENVSKWMQTDSIPCFYFEAYDEPTKAQNHAIEQYFGLMDGNLQVHEFYKGVLSNITIEGAASDVRFFPNPTKDVIFLTAECHIDFYDMQGALLFKTAGSQIDVSAYPAGIYLLKLNDIMYKLIKR